MKAKVLAWVTIAVLITAFIMAIIGFVGWMFFWIIAIICAIIAYKVIPWIGKK